VVETVLAGPGAVSVAKWLLEVDAEKVITLAVDGTAVDSLWPDIFSVPKLPLGDDTGAMAVKEVRNELAPCAEVEVVTDEDKAAAEVVKDVL
jgi:hypothetical protein